MLAYLYPVAPCPSTKKSPLNGHHSPNVIEKKQETRPQTTLKNILNMFFICLDNIKYYNHSQKLKKLFLYVLLLLFTGNLEDLFSLKSESTLV